MIFPWTVLVIVLSVSLISNQLGKLKPNLASGNISSDMLNK